MKNEVEELFEGLQYVGRAGISADCLDAILRILQFGDTINKAWLLTHENRHCFLLHINERFWVAVKSGFGSGYGGEGPKTLAMALQILDLHGAEIEEYEVKWAVMDRLDRSALRSADIEALFKAEPVRPQRWNDYVLGGEGVLDIAEHLWRKLPPVIPFGILDGRLADLALDFFNRPDETLMKGFRRLEEAVRSHAQVDGHGAKLFRKAFDPQKGVLVWQGLTPAETESRLNLFSASFGACRNPRAHKEIKSSRRDQVSEFLLLNMLFRMEREATGRET